MEEKEHNKAIRDLTYLHSLIVGKMYKDLNRDQRRILYAVELWKDGMDIDQLVPEMVQQVKAGVVSNTLPLVSRFPAHLETPANGWVDEQLRSTFGYVDSQLVGSL